MIEVFNAWLNLLAEKLSVIAKLVTVLHSARRLLVDAIEDNTQLRRGQPVVHKIYGVPQTINTSYYVFFLAFKELQALRNYTTETSQNKNLDTIVTGELLSLHRDQGLDILWRASL